MDLTTMRTFDDDEVVDAVVVGTGAGGAPLLSVLAAAGWRVVALEAGSVVADEGFVADETEATHINWMEERRSGGATPTAFGPNNSGFGVGGSTLHWGAFTPRPDEDDLALRSRAGVGEDWPFGLEELRPYLERVEHTIGVSGPAHYPWDPNRRYRWSPVPRNASAAVMAAGCEAMGVRATDAPAAVLPAPAAGRGGCVNCGLCHQGCRTGAKASTANIYLPAAVAAGAEIRADSRVVGITRDPGGKVDGVVYVRDGVERRQRCATLVLAAGGVETPRLLLHTGLANSSGQVGRHFMAHGATQVWGRFDDAMRAYRGYPSSLITEDFRRPVGVDFAGGYLIQSLGAMPATFATTLVRGAGLWGRDLVAAMTAYPQMAGVGINAECLPSEQNTLVLSDGTDAFGVPIAEVSFTAGANEDAVRTHAVRTMTAVLEAAGARSTVVVERTAHTIGTARMAADPDRGVVDPDGRSHDIDNLWICDNAVFPSSLIANPALTIMALSLRTAERMLAGSVSGRRGRARG